MAAVLITGFDIGVTTADGGGFTTASVGTNSYSTSVVRGAWSRSSFRANPATSATGAIRLYGIDANGRTTSSGMSLAISYVRFGLYVATLPASNSEPFLAFCAGNTVVKLELRLTSAGNIAAYLGGTSLITTGTATISTGTWYLIEAKCGTGNGGAVEWKVDGVSDVATTANITAVNTGLIAIGKHNNRNSQTVDFYYDDFLLDDANWPGDGCSTLLYPIGAGTYTNYTRGGADSGNNWDQANEVPPNDDTDYLITGTSGSKENFDMTSCATAGVNGTINAVRISCHIKNHTSSAAISTHLKSGGTESESSGAFSASTYASISKVYATDPDTSTAWTTTGLDAVEAGTNSIGANAGRVTGVYLIADYVPSSDIDTEPDPVVGTWAVPSVTAQAAATVTPDPIVATWSTVSTALNLSLGQSPVALTWSVVSPTLALALDQSSVVATWSVIEPTTSTASAITTDSVTSAWSIAAWSLSLNLDQTPVIGTWSVPIADLLISAVPDSITSTWTIAAPALALYFVPVPVTGTWTVAAPTPTLFLGQTPVIASWSVVATSSALAQVPAAIASTWSTVSPSLTLAFGVDPVVGTWIVPESIISFAASTTPDPVVAIWSVAAPSLTLTSAINPLIGTWIVTEPSTFIDITTIPDPIIATWNVVAPSLSLAVLPDPITSIWSVTTSAFVLDLRQDAISVLWSLPDPTLLLSLAITPISVNWTVATPSLNTGLTPNPVALTWLIPEIDFELIVLRTIIVNWSGESMISMANYGTVNTQTAWPGQTTNLIAMPEPTKTINAVGWTDKITETVEW